jgi:hypothetical protein
VTNPKIGIAKLRMKKEREIRKRIAELEAITNRTVDEERELQNKKQELEDLSSSGGNNPNPQTPSNTEDGNDNSNINGKITIAEMIFPEF